MRTSTKRNRLISILLAMTLASALFVAVPQTAFAADATALKTTIEGFDHAGQGTLSATVSGNTVTVTGSVVGAVNIILLDIDPGITVVWKASYHCVGTQAGLALINVKGGGTFEVSEGGSIIQSSLDGPAIGSHGSGIIRVNGGTVSSGDLRTIVVEGPGRVEVISGTVVNHNPGDGSAIYAGAQATSVTISGGEVLAYGSGATIATNTGTGAFLLTVSGGFVDHTGMGPVRGIAIHSQGAGEAIHVSGGIVQSSTGNAILATGLGSSVEVSGGFVHGVGIYPAIEARDITVGPGAWVRAGGENDAIMAIGRDSVVTINGGRVTAGNGFAILADDYSTVTINGGFVFAFGTAVTGDFNDVILMFAGYPTMTLSGTGIVCAWNQAAGHSEYAAGTADDLVVEPANTAAWGINDCGFGISYTYGSATGFLWLVGVHVEVPTGPPAPAELINQSQASSLLTVSKIGFISKTVEEIKFAELASIRVK